MAVYETLSFFHERRGFPGEKSTIYIRASVILNRKGEDPPPPPQTPKYPMEVGFEGEKNNVHR
jgi:hypothetical protein